MNIRGKNVDLEYVNLAVQISILALAIFYIAELWQDRRDAEGQEARQMSTYTKAMRACWDTGGVPLRTALYPHINGADALYCLENTQ